MFSYMLNEKFILDYNTTQNQVLFELYPMSCKLPIKFKILEASGFRTNLMY